MLNLVQIPLDIIQNMGSRIAAYFAAYVGIKFAINMLKTGAKKARGEKHYNVQTDRVEYNVHGSDWDDAWERQHKRRR